MNLSQFLDLLDDTSKTVVFSDSIAIIDSLYTFTPITFQNGNVVNAAGENNGSCKILSFGHLLHLSEQQTLRCFGEFYQEVVDSTEGNDHQNIRQFMLHGWSGVVFDGCALKAVNLSSTRTN